MGLLLFLISTGLSYLYWTTSQIFVSPNSQKAASASLPATPTPTPKPNTLNIALLGYGGPGHEGGLLTDTIIVAHIDDDRDTITLISIPRDLWVLFPVEGDQQSYWKINAAYAIGADDEAYPHKLPQYTGGHVGGGALAKQALSNIIGQPVDYFISIDFHGFESAIDHLGGISINVTHPFVDPWYPTEGKETDPCGKSEEEIAATVATLSGDLLLKEFPCRFETLDFASGLTTMDGATALKFARSRHSASFGNDFGRSERQRQLILALRDKLLAPSTITKLLPLINDLSRNTKTDLDLRLISKLVGNASKYSDYQVSSLALTTDNLLQESLGPGRQYILTPDPDTFDLTPIHRWLKDQLDHPELDQSAD